MSNATGNKDIVLVCDDSYLSHVEGKILTIIEAVGLPEKQQESIKSLVRGAVWDDAHSGWMIPADVKEWSEFMRKQSE